MNYHFDSEVWIKEMESIQDVEEKPLLIYLILLLVRLFVLLGLPPKLPLGVNIYLYFLLAYLFD